MKNFARRARGGISGVASVHGDTLVDPKYVGTVHYSIASALQVFAVLEVVNCLVIRSCDALLQERTCLRIKGYLPI